LTAGLTLVTGLVALAFCLVHLFVGRLRFLDREPRSRWLSFAGGVAVAYVFLHMLPELGAHSGTFHRATGLRVVMAESAVYGLALLGLAIFYGTERALKRSRDEGSDSSDTDRPESSVFWLHIAATSLLIFVIGYLLNHREDASLPGLVLYFFAMALHFVTADFGTRFNHPELYDHRGRWVLCLATLAGWGLGTLISVPQIAVGGLFAFVAGAIVLVVLKEELPEERKSYFLPFAGGSLLYTALVLGEQALTA
jgi:zinc transporter ZupT